MIVIYAKFIPKSTYASAALKYFNQLTFVVLSKVAGYRLFDCRSRQVADVTDYYVLDAGGGSTSQGDFCRAVAPQQVEGNAYDVSVLFYDVKTRGKAEATLSGIMYNLLDENNYDFVLFGYDC